MFFLAFVGVVVRPTVVCGLTLSVEVQSALRRSLGEKLAELPSSPKPPFASGQSAYLPRILDVSATEALANRCTDAECGRGEETVSRTVPKSSTHLARHVQ